VTAQLIALIRFVGWLSLFAGFTWAAFSIKSLHELPRNIKTYGLELVASNHLPELVREDAQKIMKLTGDEAADKLPSTVAPVCLMLLGGMIVGAVRRNQKTI
jgi:hypothetical protein